jgi:hypothetical protein
MTGLSEDCCADAARPMTSNAGAKICGTRAYSGLIFVPDIHFRVSLIAAFPEFTPSTSSLTAGPTIDDSMFILNQMVHNDEGFKKCKCATDQGLGFKVPQSGIRGTVLPEYRGSRFSSTITSNRLVKIS